MPQTVPDFESELYRLEELVLSMDGYGIFTILPRERRCRMLNITGEGCGAFFRSSKKLYEHVYLCHLPDNLHERRPHLLHLTLLPSIGRFSLHRTDFQGFVRSLKERLKVQMLIAKGQEIQQSSADEDKDERDSAQEEWDTDENIAVTSKDDVAASHEGCYAVHPEGGDPVKIEGGKQKDGSDGSSDWLAKVTDEEALEAYEWFWWLYP